MGEKIFRERDNCVSLLPAHSGDETQSWLARESRELLDPSILAVCLGFNLRRVSTNPLYESRT